MPRDSPEPSRSRFLDTHHKDRAFAPVQSSLAADQFHKYSLGAPPIAQMREASNRCHTRFLELLLIQADPHQSGRAWTTIRRLVPEFEEYATDSRTSMCHGGISVA